MDVRRQHINLQYTGGRSSGADTEQVAHLESHAFAKAIIVRTIGTWDFFQCVNGKSSEALSSVSAGQCTRIDLGPPALPLGPDLIQERTEEEENYMFGVSERCVWSEVF